LRSNAELVQRRWRTAASWAFRNCAARRSASLEPSPSRPADRRSSRPGRHKAASYPSTGSTRTTPLPACTRRPSASADVVHVYWSAGESAFPALSLACTVGRLPENSPLQYCRITFRILTHHPSATSVYYRWFKIEASLFNAHEPVSKQDLNLTVELWVFGARFVSAPLTLTGRCRSQSRPAEEPGGAEPGDVRRMTARVMWHKPRYA